MVTIPCDEATQEILVAILGEKGFDSFQETEEGLEAYIEEGLFSEKELEETLLPFSLRFSVAPMDDKNWNEEWEKNFESIDIDGECYVRAPFHETRPEIAKEVIIKPQMSFGTGHHSTTYLMLKTLMNDIDVHNESVLDVGCGTGILAIYAKKYGAKHVEAFDIDEWSFNNTPENILLNEIEKFPVYQGTISSVPLEKDKYGIILANINKNVLLEEIPLYTEKIAKNGYLVLSGFYENDVKDLEEAALNHGLKLQNQRLMNNWACLLFVK